MYLSDKVTERHKTSHKLDILLNSEKYEFKNWKLNLAILLEIK